MKTFSIAELEKFSLIKAHTFRTWEQRYGLSTAKRSATNIRYYTLEDLAFVLNLCLLNRYGCKISSLAYLDRSTIREKVIQLKEEPAKKEHQINQLILYMFALNIEDFDLTLDSAVTHWGIETTIEDVIIPFLERLQLFSYKGHTSSEYHLVVTALRKKFILAIEQAAAKQSQAKSALLFLPQGEHYDLLLLYMNYKLSKAGLSVLYMGTDISTKNLKVVIQTKQPQFLVTYHSSSQPRNKNNLQAYLCEADHEAFFIVGTPPVCLSDQASGKMKYTSYRQVDSTVLACTKC